MNRPKALRVAAICTSVALVAGYVIYRSVGTMSTPAPQPTVPVAGGQPGGVGDITTTVEPQPTDMFVGSKSAAVFEPPKPRAIMGGSKSLVLTEPETIEPAKPKPADAPAPPAPTNTPK